MTVETSWYVPGKVVYRQYFDEVTEEDIITIKESLPLLLEEASDGLMYSIEDLSQITALKVSLATVRTIKLPKARLGWSIVIMNNDWIINRFAKFMGATAAQMLGIPLRTANSFEEAIAFLKDVDPKVARALEAEKLSA
jgi:hypothetical protein